MSYPARAEGLVNRIKKKENLPNCGLCCPYRPQSKTEKKRKERLVRRPCEGTEETVEHESDGDTNCNWWSWCSHRRIGIETGELGNKNTDHPNNGIIEIGLNTVKSSGDLRRHAVTQTPVINHLLVIA